MVEVKVNDNNTYEMSELLLDTMDDDYSYTEEIESQLCIPQDPIEDILELFPSFNNQLISSSDLLFEAQEFEENIEKNKFEEESINVANKKRCYADPMLAAANKKQRSKRVAKQYADKEKRKCTHCQTEKTPLWRIGPLGPKTLCNACGVRYKSGRLLPEYRPASSPTFNVSRHSNFHKRILLKRKTNLLGSFY